MQSTEFLIIGGGITNLAFAAALTSDDYLIYEAQDDVGGYCQTIKRDGFVWDYSGHFFHFRHKDIEQMFVERIGASRVRKVEKRSKIYTEGNWIDFPFQKNIHQLPQSDFIDCLVDLFEKEDKPAANFKEMLFSKFGRGISERFLLPYNEKLYATDLSRLDVDAMGRFFPYADLKDIVSGFRQANNQSYNSTFTYPEGGAIEYVQALASEVPQDRILLSEGLAALDLRRRVATTTKGRTIAYEHLVSSAPFVTRMSFRNAEPDVSAPIHESSRMTAFCRMSGT